MADGTKIEWTDATWNPITGCSVVSPGCTNCYAMRLAGTRLKHIASRAGLTRVTKAGPVWNGEVRFNEEWLDQPLRWKAPRMIFVCAHGDLFAEGVPNEWIDRVFAVMALAPQHTFQVLTKRAERMRSYLAMDWASRSREEVANLTLPTLSVAACDAQDLLRRYGREHFGAPMPLPNVWLGVSAEDRRRWDERVPILFAMPAAVRWVSAEPLIGPLGDVDLTDLDWIVAGGESGAGARPMHPDWVRSIRDQCAAADVPFLFKQWGAHEADEIGREDARSISFPPGHVIFRNVGKKAAGRRLDGVTHDAFPQVRP